jgi:hypothetical protein
MATPHSLHYERHALTELFDPTAYDDEESRRTDAPSCRDWKNSPGN